jgi:AcrR family transcriptional regulator
MASEVGVRAQQAQETRAALVAAARRLFAEKGYHATGTPELVAAAGVTRGALYHHFADKEALFEAVFRQVEGELVDSAADSVRNQPDPWRQLQDGGQAFLKLVAANRDMQRILLIDGPAVLGWRRWRELDTGTTLGLMTVSFTGLIEAGTIAAQPVEPLAHLVLAALNEAALVIAHSHDPEAARAEVGPALAYLIEGLKARP